MEQRVAAIHREIGERLDRERGGTPQERYVRELKAARDGQVARDGADAGEPETTRERGPPAA
jgi:hypothetical protein